MAKSPTRTQKRQAELRIDRRAKALEFRKAGLTYQQIADKLKVSIKTAFQDVKECLKEAAGHRDALADELLDLELERLDAIYRANYQAAFRGDAVASRVCLQASKQRVDLLGLASPNRHEVTGAGGEKIIPLEAIRMLAAMADAGEVDPGEK